MRLAIARRSAIVPQRAARASSVKRRRAAAGAARRSAATWRAARSSRSFTRRTYPLFVQIAHLNQWGIVGVADNGERMEARRRSGDGPDYTGPVRVVGDDPHGLDADGIGCQNS